MENASKALIIAGAILIAILLISIGIIIMNAINNPVERARNQSDSQAIQIFNSQFTGYTGVQSASSIRALMTTVSSSNGSEEEALAVKVFFNNPTGGVDGTTVTRGPEKSPGDVSASVHAQMNYRVRLIFGGETEGDAATKERGYVCEIWIQATRDRR